MKKITSANLNALILTMLFSLFYGEGTFAIIKQSGVDSYLCVLLSIIFTIPLILIFSYLFSYEDKLDIFKKNKKIFGFSFIPNIIICLFAVLIGSMAMFNLTNFLVTQYLYETPPLAIGIIFSILVMFVCTKDMSTLFKSSTIFLTINLILSFIAILGLIPEFEMDNLLPFLEHGVYNPLIGALYIVLINIVPVFLILIVPKERVLNFKKKHFFISYSVFILLAIVMILFVLGTLGVNLARLYQYPEYIVLRKVNIFDFLNRVENVLVIQWIFGLFTVISFCVFVLREYFKFKYTIHIGIILILLVSYFLFNNLTNFNTFVYNIYPFISIFFLVFMIVSAIVVRIKSKT